MTSDNTKREALEWTDEELKSIEDLFSRYPTNRSAMLPLLWMAQHRWGSLSNAQTGNEIYRLVGRTLELPPSEVLAVATFYSMLKKKPTGEVFIEVCQTLPCWLRGAGDIISYIQERYELDASGVSPDGRVQLAKVECLASCGSAPMMQIGEHFYEFLTKENVDEIIGAMLDGNPLPTPRPEASQWQWNLES